MKFIRNNSKIIATADVVGIVSIKPCEHPWEKAITHDIIEATHPDVKPMFKISATAQSLTHNQALIGFIITDLDEYHWTTCSGKFIVVVDEQLGMADRRVLRRAIKKYVAELGQTQGEQQ